MARRKRRTRRYRRWQRIPFQIILTTSTLANNIVLKATTLDNTEDFQVVSIDATCNLRGGVATEGPLLIGFALGDLTVTEIKEALEAAPSSPDDIIPTERSKRPVRKTGSFPGLATNETLNNGNPKRTKFFRMIRENSSLGAWVQNRSGSALSGGQVISIEGTIYGWWAN